MKWALNVFILLQFSVPINSSVEPRPRKWIAEHPLGLIANFFNPKKEYVIDEDNPLMKHVFDALNEQSKWISLLLKRSDIPMDSVIDTDVILLSKFQKFKDWDPVWVRRIENPKPGNPEKNRIRVFLNEPHDSPISEYCRNNNMSDFILSKRITMQYYFHQTKLICESGKAVFDGGSLGRGLLMFYIMFVCYIISLAIVLLMSLFLDQKWPKSPVCNLTEEDVLMAQQMLLNLSDNNNGWDGSPTNSDNCSRKRSNKQKKDEERAIKESLQVTRRNVPLYGSEILPTRKNVVSL